MPLKDAFHDALASIGLYPPKKVYNELRVALCTDGQSAVVERIVKKYPDAVRWETPGDMQPLAYAMWQKQLGAAEALIRSEPSILRDTNNNGGSALGRAVGEGNEKDFDFLLKLGADPLEIDKDGNNFLHRVALGRYKSNMIPLLLAQGVDPRARNNKGETPLMLAAKNGSLFDAFHALDPDLAQRDDAGNSLLVAAVDAAPGVIKKLAALGVDLEVTDSRGETALDIALSRYKPGSAMALIEAGAKLDFGHPCLQSCMDDFRECGDAGFDMLIDEKRAEAAENERKAALQRALEKEQQRLAHEQRVIAACTGGTESAVAVTRPLQLKKPTL